MGAALGRPFLIAVTSQASLKDVKKYPEQMVVPNGSKFLVLLIEKENTTVFIWFYRYFLFYRTNIRNCRLDRLSFSGGKEIMVVYI